METPTLWHMTVYIADIAHIVGMLGGGVQWDLKSSVSEV